MSIAQVDQARYGEQLSAKVQRVKAKFTDFVAPELEVFESPCEHYRMRAEFRVWHDGSDAYYIMFQKPADNSEQRHERVRIDHFPVGSLLINELMKKLMEEVHEQPVLKTKLYQVNFHTTLTGHAMVTMIYHKKLGLDWQEAAKKLRPVLGSCPSSTRPFVDIIGRSHKQKVELETGFVCETLSVDGHDFTYKQVEGAFSQPNGRMCEKMLTWARDVTRNSTDHDLLELYCGNGNFTVALASNFRRVVATEMSKASVAAAEFNLQANGVSNTKIARLTAEEFTAAWTGAREFERAKTLDLKCHNLQTILVDPPRAGCDADTATLLKEFKNVVYISCNPETLHSNLLELKDSHNIQRFAIFDQFPYTDHIECGVYLTQKD
ncbi:g403 [Coccomyxa elongata]